MLRNPDIVEIALATSPAGTTGQVQVNASGLLELWFKLQRLI